MGKKKSAQQGGSGGGGAAAAPSPTDRESFQMEDEDAWEVVTPAAAASLTKRMADMQIRRDDSDSDVEMKPATQEKSNKTKQPQQQQSKQPSKQQQAQQPKQQAGQAPRKPSPARVEEVSGSDDEADSSAAHSGVQQRKKRVVTLPPKAGAAGAGAAATGAPMTALQRKVMQKSNKNSVKGLGSKGKQQAAASSHELINEEDEEGAGRLSGLSDDDEEEEGQSESSDAEFGSDDDDIIWETPQQRRAKREAAAGAAAHAASNPSKSGGWSLSTLLRWFAVLALLGGLVWIRLQDASLLHGLDPDDMDMTSQAPGESVDLYTVLELDRKADLKAVKAAYRRLVLVTHPDKNPGCDDCIARFQQVQKAYDVLSNKDKRAMYDAIETSYDLLKSEAVELTSQNFESEVLHKDDVWVIQIYTDWHKSAIRFSAAWEEAIQRYGSLVRFGRVHAQRERDLTRTMPAKFNVIPAVVIYSNGRFETSKTFLESSRHSLPKLARFIADSFPNSIESVPNTPAEIRSFMRRSGSSKETAEQATMLFFPDFVAQAAEARKQSQSQSRDGGGSQQQRFQQQMLQSNVQSVNEPSLSIKSIARKYQYSFLFGQVQQIAEPAAWKSWIKDVSSAFKLSPPSVLPAMLYQESSESSPVWLAGGTGKLTKEKLMSHMNQLHRRMVPWFNSHSYARHCLDASSQRPAACVLALACQPSKIGGDLEFNSFASGALAMLKLQAFKNAKIQFGKVDVARQTDMAPLCQALPEKARNSTEMGIVVVMERGTELSFYGSADHPNQQFDAWLMHVLKKDGTVQSSPAPYLPAVHIPDDMLAVQVPGYGQVLLPLKWLYGGAILVSLWFLAPVISRHFGSFLYLMFALSIIIPGYELAKDAYAKYMTA